MKAQLQQTILNLAHIENNIVLVCSVGDRNVTSDLKHIEKQVEEVRNYLQDLIEEN